MVFVEASRRLPMHDRSSWKCVAAYYAMACGVSWALWAPLVLGHDGLKLLDISPSVPIFVSVGTLGPLLACYVAHRVCDGNWRAVRFLPSHRFEWLWLLLAPALIVFCFFVVFPGLISEGLPAAWRWRPGVLTGILVPMFNYNLLGGPLFEEFGWRGFLQSRLQRLMSPWTAAVSVGTLWAAWHLPLFLLRGWTSASVAGYFLILVGASVVMAFGFNASGRSILVAIIMHSAFNSSPRFIGPYLDGTPARSYPAGEWYIAAAFLLTGTALAIASRGRLSATIKGPTVTTH
jgi:uncharacterized protein